MYLCANGPHHFAGGRKDATPLIDETIPLYYMAILKIIQSLVRKCSKQNIIPIFSREDYMYAARVNVCCVSDQEVNVCCMLDQEG